MRDSLLQIDDLSISFDAEQAGAHVVTNLSLSIDHGEVVALVGESGSGKTLTALSIAGLLPSGASIRVKGHIKLNGQNLSDLDERQLQNIRGKNVSYIFQEPGTALNPVYRVGSQIEEALRLNTDVTDHPAKIRELLHDVGIEDPERVARSYPHQISGGQQQRVMIAMALASEPDLLIADEPTTALDVTVQAQILKLLTDLQRNRDMSVLMITHNLAIAAQLAQRMYVMYAGQIVEMGDSATLIRNPRHPYTRALLHAVPRLHGERVSLKGIPGTSPSGGKWPQGCRFHPRCGLAEDSCRLEKPMELEKAGDGRWSRCQFWDRVESS